MIVVKAGFASMALKMCYAFFLKKKKKKVYRAVAKILGCLIHAIGKARNLAAEKFFGFYILPLVAMPS